MKGHNNTLLNDAHGVGRLKVAVIGCGKMGQHHMKAIKSLGFADIIAVADPKPNMDKLKGIVGEGTVIFSDPVEMLERTRPDVVHIVTPPSSHAELARVCIERGFNFYMEKPFTLRRAEAEEILSLAENRRVKVCAGHQVIFENTGRTALDSLKEIGRLIHVESYFAFRTVRKNITPVGQLIDILPHPVYTILHFLQASDPSSTPELVHFEGRADGEVRAMIRSGQVNSMMVVTLNGRPVESYLRAVGTNGSIYADFIRGIVIKHIGPGASAPAVILYPFIHAKQLVFKSVKSFMGLIFAKHKSYPGLAELIDAFYKCLLNDAPSPVTASSIAETVGICEQIGERLGAAHEEAEISARKNLATTELGLPMLKPGAKLVLVTGGTGFLGKSVVKELRNAGLPVRAVSRNLPLFSKRVPGTEYVSADLGGTLGSELFAGVDCIVHCAAETAGDLQEHVRNSVEATRSLVLAAAKAGVKKIIHVSSLAVLKPGAGRGKPIDEDTPLDAGNRLRGPYVWAKAEAEKVIGDLCSQHGIEFRIVRPGPLVDFSSFDPPGRLGRELGPVFVAIGSRKSPLSVCDVGTAAHVIRSFVENFDSAPNFLNLVESPPPTRGELVERVLRTRPHLKVYWFPMFVLKALSPGLKLLQKILLPGKQPVDIASAFTSEIYRTDLAASAIKKAKIE